MAGGEIDPMVDSRVPESLLRSFRSAQVDAGPGWWLTLAIGAVIGVVFGEREHLVPSLAIVGAGFAAFASMHGPTRMRALTAFATAAFATGALLGVAHLPSTVIRSVVHDVVCDSFESCGVSKPPDVGEKPAGIEKKPKQRNEQCRHARVFLASERPTRTPECSNELARAYTRRRS